MFDIVQIFKALSDETRLQILVILSSRKICAKGIARHLNISEAAVSQHLKILKEAGIITGEKIGYPVYYTLQKSALSEITSFVNDINNNIIPDNYSLGINMPFKCTAVCRANKNKCCHKKDLEGENL